MNEYTTPTLEIVKYEVEDIITTSSGTLTPKLDQGEGNWNWSLF